MSNFMVKSLLDLIDPGHLHNLKMLQANGTVYHTYILYYHFPSVGHHELKVDSFSAGIPCSHSGLPDTLTVGEALHQSSALIIFWLQAFTMLPIGDISKPSHQPRIDTQSSQQC
ncbi:hypothetical protein TSMEX_000985 [Taenia solium]|eukprot:TsM_001009300 transcript=TsM_001009300 gene=TsM_001009300